MPFLFWSDLTIYTLCTIISAALSLATFGAGPRRSLNRTFALFTLMMAVWSATAAILRLALWQDVGNATLLSELSTLTFILLGPSLFFFSARYTDRATRAIKIAVALGGAFALLLAIPIFKGQVIHTPALTVTGMTIVQITAWGWVAALLPIFFLGWSLILFFQRRRRSTDIWIAVSVITLIGGIVGAGLWEIHFPLISIATALSISILGYSVLSQQLFNPLNEKTLALQREITERERIEKELSERATRIELVAHIAQQTIRLSDVDELLSQAVHLIGQTFDYHNVCILLVEDESIVLRAATQPLMDPVSEQIRLDIGQGITGWVAEHGIPLNVPDVGKNSQYCQVVEKIQTQSEIAVPINYQNKIIGVLDVQSINVDAFSGIDLLSLGIIADQLAVSISNAQLYSETHQRAKRLSVVNHIGRAVGATLEQTTLLDAVYQEVSAIFQVDAFFVALYDKKANELEFRFNIDRDIRIKPERRPLGPGLTSKVIQANAPLLIRNMEQEQDLLSSSMVWGTMQLPASWLGVPMQIGGEIIGVVCVQAYHPEAYGEEEVLLLSTIADQIAVAVESTRLYEAMRQELGQRKRLEAQLVQAQKMEAIGRLAGGIAHDFNNLLTAIQGYTELVIECTQEQDPNYIDLQEIQKAASQAAALTGQLLTFSRKKTMQTQILDLNQVVQESQNMLRRMIGEDIELSTVINPELGKIKADPVQIQQVIMNLAVNARDAMPNGGKLTLETTNVELDATFAQQHVGLTPGSYVLLSVSDTGTGLSPQAREHLFEPFFTTKAQGKGTGLGLATVHGIIKQSDGHIFAYSEQGFGTTFKIYLPRIVQDFEPLHLESVPIGLPGGAETVLLVEDDPMVRALSKRVLEQSGYMILEAAQADQAIQHCAKYTKRIDLMITDIVMPGGMNGYELSQKVRPMRPDMYVLYISGYTDNSIIQKAILEKGAAFLQKPFRPAALANKVRELLDIPHDFEPK